MAISPAWQPKNEIGFTTSGTEVITTLNMTVLLAKSNVPTYVQLCLVVSQRLHYQNISLHMYMKHSIIAQKYPLHN